MRTYLLDKFDITNLNEYPLIITVDRMEVDEFCITIDLRQEEGELVNGITNPITIREIEKLCNLKLQKGEEIIPKFEKYDKVILVDRRVEKTRFFEIRIDD